MDMSVQIPAISNPSKTRGDNSTTNTHVSSGVRMPNGVLATSGSQVSVINTALGEKDRERKLDRERKKGMEREHGMDLSCRTFHKKCNHVFC